MGKKKILVVDDEEAVRLLLTAELERNGYEVITAADEDGAIQKAQNEKPDLIIMDIMLPGSDGTEVAACLKEGESTADIPVIFLTGLKSEEDDMHVENSSSMILSKPIRMKYLLARIEELLSQSKPA